MANQLNQLALGEARWVREAQRGNPWAVASLLDPHLPALWSVCDGMVGHEEHALSLIDGFREHVRQHIRRHALSQPFGRALYRWLWDYLCVHLGIPANAHAGAPALPHFHPGTLHGGDESGKRIRQVVRDSPARWRLIYLIALVTELPADDVAALTGTTEVEVRRARMHLTARIHEALAP